MSGTVVTCAAVGVSLLVSGVFSALLTRRTLARQREHHAVRTREAHARYIRNVLELVTRADISGDLEYPGTAAVALWDSRFNWDAAVAEWNTCGKGPGGGWCQKCLKCRQVVRWVREGLVSPEAVPGGMCCADGPPVDAAVPGTAVERRQG